MAIDDFFKFFECLFYSEVISHFELHNLNYPITSKKFWVPRIKTGSKGEVLSSEGEKCGKQLRPHVAIINQARTNTAGKSNFQ